MYQYLAIREIREILLKAMEKAADTELSQYLHQIDEKLEYFLKKDIDFKEIVDGLDDGIFITDHQGNVLYVNPAYTRNTGITQEDVLNHNITELTGEDKLYTGGAVPDVLKQANRLSAFLLPTKPENLRPDML